MNKLSKLKRMHLLFRTKSEPYILLVDLIKNNSINAIKYVVETLHFNLSWPFPNTLSSLHYAAMFSTPEVIYYLINHGALINYRDAAGCTPLARAVHGNLPANVEALLIAGANQYIPDYYEHKQITLYEFAHKKNFHGLYHLLNQHRTTYNQQNAERINCSVGFRLEQHTSCA